jgi:hypothetical protein
MKLAEEPRRPVEKKFDKTPEAETKEKVEVKKEEIEILDEEKPVKEAPKKS